MRGAFKNLQGSLARGGQLTTVLLALAIGILGGFCAVGFRWFIQFVQELSWGRHHPSLQYFLDLPFYWKIAAPALGGLVVALIVKKFAPEAKGHGVPEVIDAVALRGGRIRPRVAIAKMMASGISIGTGGSVGREGPIVQIGAAIGSAVGQWLRIDPARLRTLVGCGAAAGVAGTFNAPIAGALFAVEVILGDFGVAQFSPIVISSVAATVVSHHFLGNYPAFIVPEYSLVSAQELFAYAGLGILAGFVALGFIRSLYGTIDIFEKFKVHPVVKAMLGGAVIGTIGIFLPHIFGVGYEAIEGALNGTMLWWFMALLVVVKILAVSITIGSGGSGGVFAPSLFIGAMLGGSVGTVVHTLWPNSTGTPGAYALVGMGAVVAAGTHAPITAILIIFELTNDYAIILPLMISCIIATLLTMRIQKASIYTMKLLRRGVDVQRGRDVNVLHGLSVKEIMRQEMALVSPADDLSVLIAKYVDHPGLTLFVVDAEQKLLGAVTAEELRPFIKDSNALHGVMIAHDVMVTEKFPAVSVDDSLSDVMQRLGGYRGEVPVLDGEKLIGVIWPQDVIAKYNTEIFKRDMVGSMPTAISPKTKRVPMLGDATVAEVHVPYDFIGKAIKDLSIRQELGVTILMIKQDAENGDHRVETAPTADYVFRQGDTLLIMGPDEKVDALK